MTSMPARLVVALGVVAVYFMAWGPVRSALVAHGAAPLATWATDVTVEPTVDHRATLIESRQLQRWQAPGGLLLLYGAVALALAGAGARLFGTLALAHLVIGALSFVAFVAATRGASWGPPTQTFVDDYLLVGVTLAIAALAVVSRERIPASTSDTSGASSLETP